MPEADEIVIAIEKFVSRVTMRWASGGFGVEEARQELREVLGRLLLGIRKEVRSGGEDYDREHS